jgi:hypothetical protein
MSQYRYGTILRVLNDDPTNSLEEGDIIIEAGKLEDGDSYAVLSDNGPVKVEMETVAVYESDHQMGEREAKEFARDRYVEEQEGEA